ncbi:PREDICTED: trace amine-associated receptor 1-like, partial [Cyprinodon variegatus]|uniref:trace amine-associated receptor 1-like n=1 Tax=Cyprinodon variegatus TaxID=28743 RepID=UPI00074283B4
LLYIFFAFLSIVTVCGNLLIIISVGYFAQLRTPTNSLIVSLAVTDLLIGSLVIPFSMAFSLSSCLRHAGLICQVRDSFDVSLGTCSILNLCCIAVDRYYAVCQPLIYTTKITNRVVLVMILVSWGISGLIGVGITIAGLNHNPCKENCSLQDLLPSTVGPVFSFYLPALIMLCIYFKIFLVALRQARIIKSNKTSGVTASRGERKATRTLAIVMGVFLICWAPLFVCITVAPFSTDAVPFVVIEALNWVTLTNSMLNPFIYAFFYSWYRTAFRMIISGKIFQGDFSNSKLS